MLGATTTAADADGAAREPRPVLLHRPLDRTETLFHAFNSAGAYLSGAVAALEGPLDEDLLGRALARVQQRHPKLRARIVDGPQGPRFVDGADEPPALRVVAPGASAASLLGEQIHGAYAASDPLWRCTFAPAPRPGALHHVAVGVHHGMADGRSMLQIFTDLVEACAALHDGRAPRASVPTAAPLDAVLPQPSMRASLLHRVRTLRLRSAPRALQVVPALGRAPADGRRSRVVLRSAPPDLLGRLEERGRAEQATVEGALTAALVSALHDLSGSRGWAAISHQVNLRNRCRPRVEPEQIGCFVCGTYTRHPLDGGAGFWETARSATRELRGTIEGNVCAAGVHATRPRAEVVAAYVARHARDPETLGRVGVAGISNRGRVPSVASGPFRVREYWGAAGNHVVGNFFQLFCGSLEGRLSFTLVTVDPLVSAQGAERFADAILERVEGAVA